MSKIAPQEWVWFKNNANDIYRAGQVIQLAGPQIEILPFNETQPITISTVNVRPMHQSSVQGVEDMIKLADLHDGSLLYNISKRYFKDEIYTFTGNILTAVNPYKYMNVYGADTIRKYQGQALGDLSPHIYAIANDTHDALLKTGNSQCVVISGESGAGKTETAKHILNYLTCISAEKSLVQEQIVDASPILEAFGNAKTVRNDNSSRFGKLLKIQFDSEGNIAGALTQHYLLEKSRITHQAPEERNYHVFYQFLAGATQVERKELRLEAADKFRYLNQSGCIKLSKVNDGEMLNDLRSAFKTLDFSKFEPVIFKCIAAILHLGNVNFIKEDLGGMESASISNPDKVFFVAELLAIDHNQLANSLTRRTNITRGELFVTPLSYEQATSTRDALAKAIYGRMFSWIVSYINEITKKDDELPFVGVLDIFGFENFAKNSFEQFCINYANERLQFYFNQHIFKLEQEEYEKENINWSKIEFKDNQPTIDLISRRPFGILNILDEECNFPKSTDKSLLLKFHDTFEDDDSYIKPKTMIPFFGIKHYAGDVTYQIEGFLDKNRDTMRQDLQDLLKESGHKLIHSWFQYSAADEMEKMERSALSSRARTRSRNGSMASLTSSTESLPRNSTIRSAPPDSPKSSTMKPKSAKLITIGYQFNMSLTDLVATLESCDPFFVRCIKPNAEKLSRTIDNQLVLSQLSYTGMLATIKVRRDGFTNRLEFSDFLVRYGTIFPQALKGASETSSCIKILEKCSTKGITKEQWQIGKTKVFMRSSVEGVLETLRAEKILSHVSKIQSFFRMVQARKGFQRSRKSATKIQALMRGYLARRQAGKAMNGVIKLQALWRGYSVRKEYSQKLQDQQEASKKREEEEQQAENALQDELKAKEEELKKLLADVADEERRVKEESSRMKVNTDALGDVIGNDLNNLIGSLNLSWYSPAVGSNFVKFNPNGKTVNISELVAQSIDNSGDTEANEDKFAWTKFARIFFRDKNLNCFSTKYLKTSLLKLPGQDIGVSASLINRCLLKLTIENCDTFQIHQGISFVCEKISYMLSLNSPVPKGLNLTDELLCQLVCLTVKNTVSVHAAKAWNLLGFFLGIYAPSNHLLGYIYHHITSSAINQEINQICLERLGRTLKNGPRKSTGVSAAEIFAYFQRRPFLFEASWPDSNMTTFEIDSVSKPNDILDAIAQARGLKSGLGYSLAIEYKGVEIRLKSNETILDALAKYERNIEAPTVKTQSTPLGSQTKLNQNSQFSIANNPSIGQQGLSNQKGIDFYMSGQEPKSKPEQPIVPSAAIQQKSNASYFMAEEALPSKPIPPKNTNYYLSESQTQQPAIPAAIPTSKLPSYFVAETTVTADTIIPQPQQTSRPVAKGTNYFMAEETQVIQNQSQVQQNKASYFMAPDDSGSNVPITQPKPVNASYFMAQDNPIVIQKPQVSQSQQAYSNIDNNLSVNRQPKASYFMQDEAKPAPMPQVQAQSKSSYFMAEPIQNNPPAQPRLQPEMPNASYFLQSGGNSNVVMGPSQAQLYNASVPSMGAPIAPISASTNHNAPPNPPPTIVPGNRPLTLAEQIALRKATTK